MKKSLIVTGFMGTGKSTIGALVARKRGAAFLDTDAEIETRAGKTIRQVFDQDGEASFRKLEAAVCREVALGVVRVISTGGGALLNDETRQVFLENCVVVNLQCSLAELEIRLAQDRTRPLFKEREKFRALYASRAPLYSSLPHQIEVDGKTPLVIAEKLVKLWTLYG